MMKKTQRDFYNELLANYDLTDELRDFVNERISALDRKRDSAKAPTPTQLENQVLKNEILHYYENVKEFTNADVVKVFALSPQKASALLKQLVNDGRVTYTVVKKSKVYSVVNAE